MAPKRAVAGSNRPHPYRQSPRLQLSWSADPVGYSPARNNNPGPWSVDEHQRFLDGLEKYGCGQAPSVGAAWQAITATVGTRRLGEIQAHASRYYHELQLINAQKRKEYLLMQHIDTRWTLHEDALLEELLAEAAESLLGHDHGGAVTYPWARMATRIPGKTARDLRERYHKLCYDVSRIEAGQHVTMHLGRYPRHKPMGENNHSAAYGDDGDPDGDPAGSLDSTGGVDCVVALTHDETQRLLQTLEEVPVPARTASEVLAAVASAIAALACPTHRRPPQRETPRFGREEAHRALHGAIKRALRTTSAVLEHLVQELGLLPPPSEPRRLPRPTSSTSTASTVATTSLVFANPSPMASADGGFYFAPSPTGFEPVKDDATRSAEGLMTLRTSPVHRFDSLRRPSSRGGSSRDGSGGGPTGDFTLSSTMFPFNLVPPDTPSNANTHAHGHVHDGHDSHDSEAVMNGYCL